MSDDTPSDRSKFERSKCPIAATLDIIGDKWSLLVLRDILRGERRFNGFLKSPEKIPTNILAERLKRLERHRLIAKTAYQDRPPRHEYHLTDKGEAMIPVMQEICRWGNAYLPGTWDMGTFVGMDIATAANAATTRSDTD